VTWITYNHVLNRTENFIWILFGLLLYVLLDLSAYFALRWSLSSTILFQALRVGALLFPLVPGRRRSPLALPDFRARTRRRPGSLRLVPQRAQWPTVSSASIFPKPIWTLCFGPAQELISCFLCLQPQCPVRFAGSVILLSSCEICLFP
jgi:hypothetical protein